MAKQQSLFPPEKKQQIEHAMESLGERMLANPKHRTGLMNELALRILHQQKKPHSAAECPLCLKETEHAGNGNG